MRRKAIMRRTLVITALLAAAAGSAGAQQLADYDYENLVFRGVGFDYGHIWPGKVDPTPIYSVRFDLGFLGPAVRIAPSVSYWDSQLRTSELARLAERLSQLPPLQDAGIEITAADLGRIDWSGLSLSIDGHVLWTTPLQVLTYVGAGIGLHLLNGRGEAIDDTFIEDLLDTMSAGVAVLAGVEYQIVERFRVYGEARYTLLSDLRYPGLRVGGALMLPARQDPAVRRDLP
jgi:opacity protein-like surface antigen